MSVILCENVSKNKKLNNFSFNFLDKKTYAILGKSDSGKDVLLDILAANTSYNSGNVYLDGNKLSKRRECKNKICYINKNTSYPSNLLIKNLFKYMNRTFPKWDNYYAYNLCKFFNIDYSKTWKQMPPYKRHLIIGICALASRANITIIDDPVFDADMKIRYDFYNQLYLHKERYPRTIILSTEKVDDISFLLDRVLFLDKGKLIDFFNLPDFEDFKLLTGKTEVLLPLLNDIKIIGKEERNGTLSVCIYKNLSKDDRRKFQKYLIDITDISIEKLFVFLTTLKDHRDAKVELF